MEPGLPPVKDDIRGEDHPYLRDVDPDSAGRVPRQGKQSDREAAQEYVQAFGEGDVRKSQAEALHERHPFRIQMCHSLHYRFRPHLCQSLSCFLMGNESAGKKMAGFRMVGVLLGVDQIEHLSLFHNRVPPANGICSQMRRIDQDIPLFGGHKTEVAGKNAGLHIDFFFDLFHRCPP